MVEFRETGLPAVEAVFKAFCAYRTNAKTFAEEQRVTEDYPLRVAGILNFAAPWDHDAMTLALLTTVPTAAIKLMKNRVGEEMTGKMEEFWKHARTGYTYAESAGDTVKALALAVAIEAFDSFTEKVDRVAITMTSEPKPEARERIIQQLAIPGAGLLERLGEKVSLPSHPELEQLYREKREEYRSARQSRADLLAGLGAQMAEPEVAAYPSFESQNLLDDPKVRKAYALLLEDLRLQLGGFGAATSAGRMLSQHADKKYPDAVAASLLQTGLPNLGRDDLDFLAPKLDAGVLSVLESYNECAARGAPKSISSAPAEVRQIAVAQGILMINSARTHGEGIVDMLENSAVPIPKDRSDLIKAMRLEPVMSMAEAIPERLRPILGATGAPQMEQIFSKEVDLLKDFMRANMAARPIPPSRRLAAPKSPGPDAK